MNNSPAYADIVLYMHVIYLMKAVLCHEKDVRIKNVIWKKTILYIMYFLNDLHDLTLKKHVNEAD